MIYSNLYKIVRLLAVTGLITVAYTYWDESLIGLIFLLCPYLIVSLLANKKAYSTRLRVICRTTGCILVLILAIGLLFGIEDVPQAPIGIFYAIVFQYAVIFISEAIIGLATYE